MPATAPLSPAFVKSFVLTCRAEGLTKEATADLLHLAALGAAFKRPSFAAGFADRVAVEGLPVTKSAGALLGLGAAALGASGAADLWRNRGDLRFPWQPRPVPVATPTIGGYDAEGAKAQETGRIQHLSKGLAEVNQGAYDDKKRRTELQAVVNSGGPGAGNAIAELQRLRRSPYAGQQQAYGKQLENTGAAAAEHLAMTQQQLANLEKSRGSWWNKARAMVGKPVDFDSRERELVARKAQFTAQQREVGTLRRRLAGGYTGGNPDEIIPPQDLQSRFFSTP